MLLRLIMGCAITALCSVITSGQNNLQRAIDQFVKAPNLKHATVSISVIDLQSGTLLADHDPELSLIPASTLKVLTTSSALALLGPDFQFKTEVQYRGDIEETGVLKGNLYLKGYGDPTLASDQMEVTLELDALMESFQFAIRRAGIRLIDGYVIGDGSYYEGAINAPTWQWNDLGNYYASGAWGLNIHENFYYLGLRQRSKLGETPTIAKVTPYIPGLNFRNQLTSARRGSGDNAYIYGGPYANLRYIRGTIPVGSGIFSIKGSIPDPPLFAAQYLEKHLIEMGIDVERGAITQEAYELLPATTPSVAEPVVLYTHYSPKLLDIVMRANQKSINLYCESMLKQLGKHQSGNGSISGGIDAIESHWEEKGLNFSGINLEDGSGLSPRNSVTSSFLARLLEKIAADPDLYKSFLTSLPIAGVSGTLKYMLRNTAAQGKIKAKTGTISRVRSFAGYATTRNGRELSFAILVNNFTGSSSKVRRGVEQLMLTMAQIND